MNKMRSMHVICGLVLLAVVTSHAHRADAAGVDWRTDIRAAVKEAETKKRPLLMKITASWCGYCKKMEAQTFRNPRLAKQINECFVPVVVDADENKKLVKAIGVDGLPTTVIVSPSLEIVKKITGFKTVAQLDRDLDGLCQVGHEELASTEPPQPTPEVRPATAKSPEVRTVPVKPVTQSRPKFAFDSLCIVSLLADRKIREGLPAHTVLYRGQTICFLSAEHKQAFVADPQAYWPQNDGICPVTAMEQDTRQIGEPRAAAVYQARLWFFVSKEQRRKFAAAPEKYLSTSPR
jgi:thioredoxin-related protein/YHS domain-containing protein